ncbi:MAG: hypothetical protein FWD56_06285 [Bacteroidales bacterium]|nr:hypothetical protein [Bacteroidales bacterium]
MKKNTLIPTITAALLIIAAACSPKKSIEDQITADILSMPEMQFENAAVIFLSEPSDTEPYYTVQGGSNMATHFATSFWFHVYTSPNYEIKVYNVITDSEMTLEEWRSEATSVQELTVYLKLDGRQSGNELRILIDELIWVNINDTEALMKYGIDPEDMLYDNDVVNEKEEWVLVLTCPETTFSIVRYTDEGYVERPDVDKNTFRQHMSWRDDYTILAKVTLLDGRLLSVYEYYTP